MKATGFVGSPIRGGNVDLLVDQVLAGAASRGAEIGKVFLNGLTIRPCQSCGANNDAATCRIDDDMREVYRLLEESDLIVLGTPIYFDTVSAQMKLMIDRCNCLTPFLTQPDGSCTFRHRPLSGKRAVFVAVAGSRQEFRLARTTVKGFLAWVGAELVEDVLYGHDSVAIGGVRDDAKIMDKAFQAGVRASSACAA